MSSEEDYMSEVILLSAVVGVVSATMRMLYCHPIQWSEEAACNPASRKLQTLLESST